MAGVNMAGMKTALLDVRPAAAIFEPVEHPLQIGCIPTVYLILKIVDNMNCHQLRHGVKTLDSQTRTLQFHPPCTREATMHHTHHNRDTCTDKHKTLTFTRTLPWPHTDFVFWCSEARVNGGSDYDL